MKSSSIKISTIILILFIINSTGFSQLNLKKFKQKAKAKIEKTVSKTKKTATSNKPTNNNTTANNSTENILKTKGKNYYVSATGHGRIGSKEQPVKDLAVLISKLQTGDIVHIAAGVYIGKAGLSSDILKFAVSIIGGYSPDFSTRDPWGKYKTIFSGVNDLKAATTERLFIKNVDMNTALTIDGIIIDNAGRNRYKTDKKLRVLKSANMSNNENPSPESAPLKIVIGVNSKLTIRNCIILNSATSRGAIDVQIGRYSEAIIENNLIINNTGEGILLKAGYHKPDGMAKYYLKNNTVLFSWKFDPVASFGGNSIMMDTYLEVFASDNVFGFGDFGGINNVKKCKNLLLNHNLLFGHKKYDYKEFNSELKLEEMADYADNINENSANNFSKEVKIPISKEWARIYSARKDISRADVDAAAKVSNSGANQLRGMLGLPLQASTVKMDAEIWLHKMELEDAINAGIKKYEGVGCEKPLPIIN